MCMLWQHLQKGFLTMRSVAVFLSLLFLFFIVFVYGRPLAKTYSTRDQQEPYLRDTHSDTACQGRDGDEIDASDNNFVEGTGKQEEVAEVEEEDDESFRGDLYGYGDEMDAVTFRNAVRCFQKSVGLPQTGVVDERTRLMMQKSEEKFDQVGLPSKGGTRKRRWTLVRQRWYRNKLTFFIQNYNVNRNLSQMTKEEIRQKIIEAFKYWAAVANLTFTELNSTKADIVIGFYSGRHNCPGGQVFQYARGQLAHAFPPGPGYLGDLHANADTRFRITVVKGVRSGRLFLYVMIHEIGHSLGLAHSKSRKAVMYPVYQYDFPLKLDLDDIEGVQSIYGKKK